MIWLLLLLLPSQLLAVTLAEALEPERFRSHPEVFLEALSASSDLEGPGPQSYLLQMLHFPELSNPLLPHRLALDALLARPVRIRTQDAQTKAGPLHVAIDAHQSLDILKKLILRGASLDDARLDGIVPIQVAAITGYYEAVTLLSDFGARLDVYEFDCRPLLDSVGDFPEAADCKLLLSAKGLKLSADMEPETLFQEAAFFAARTGFLELLQSIDSEAYIGKVDAANRSIFHYAARAQDPAILQYLDPHPEDLALADNFGQTVADLAGLPNPFPLKLQAKYPRQARASEFQWTDPLWNAALYGDMASLGSLILTSPASLQAVDAEGHCLLAFAVYLSETVIESLLEAGAKLPTQEELFTLSAMALSQEFTWEQYPRKLALFQAYGCRFAASDLAFYQRSLADYEILRNSRPEALQTLPRLNDLWLPDDAMAALCQTGAYTEARACVIAASRGDLTAVAQSFNFTLNSFLYPAEDGTFTTPFIAALAAGHVDVADYLLAQRSPIDKLSERKETALSAAIDLQHPGLIRKLLDSLKLQQLKPGYSTRLDKRLHPLVQAAFLQDQATMEALLALGCDPAIIAPYIASLVLDAARQNAAFLNYLLDGGVDVNSQDASGQSPLLAAILARNHEALALLLKHPKILPNLADKQGFCPLMAAVSQDDATLIQQLVKVGAILELVNTQGRSSLEMALTGGKKQAALTLIEAGVKLNTSNQDGASPLHLATSYRDLDSMLAMLKRGALLESTDSQQNTALHRAILAGFEDAALLLIENGASGASKNRDGKTAIQLAQTAGMVSVVQAIYARTTPSLLDWLKGLMHLAVGFVLLILGSLVFSEGKRNLFRPAVAKWGRQIGKSSVFTALCSVLSSALTGTCAAAESISTWLYEADLLSLRRYLLALGFADLGACVLLLLVGTPLLWPIGIGLGLCGIFYLQQKLDRFAVLLAVGVALGLTLVGVMSIDLAATDVATTATVNRGAELAADWTIAGVAAGFLSCLLLQSVVGMQLGLLAIAYATAPPLTALFSVFAGAVLAGAVHPYYVPTPFTSKTSFIPAIKARLALVLGSLLLADILLERYAQLPLLMAAAHHLFPSSNQQLLALFVLVALAKPLLVTIALPRLEAWADSRLLPASLRASLQPRYLDPYSQKGPEETLSAIQSEQQDLLRRIQQYAAVVTISGQSIEHHKAFKNVHRAITAVLATIPDDSKKFEEASCVHKSLDIFERLVYRFVLQVQATQDATLRKQLEEMLPQVCGATGKKLPVEELRSQRSYEALNAATLLDEIQTAATSIS